MATTIVSNQLHRSSGLRGRLPRLLRLQSELASGPFYNVGRLATELGVSRRTIFRDLNVLRDAGANVVWDEECGALRLRNAQPHSAILPQNQNEAAGALILAACLSPLQEIPYISAAISSTLGALVSQWPSIQKEELGRIMRACRMVRITTRGITVNDQILRDVLSAVRKSRKIRLTLRNEGGQKIRTKLSPYGLEVDANQFLVVGRSSLHRKLCRFDLRLVDKVEILEEQMNPLPRHPLKKRIIHVENDLKNLKGF